MPLDVSGVVTGQVIQAAHVAQFYNLLTGVMTDQAVSLKNQLTVGGNHGTGAVPLTVNGVVGQTADLLQVRDNTPTVQMKVSAAGVVTAHSGLVVDAGGATVTAGGLTVSAGGAAITGNSTITGTLGGLTGLTVASGGATITAGGLTVTAGGLQVTAGNVGIGVSPTNDRGLFLSTTLNANGGHAEGLALGPILVAQVNGDTLYGINLAPTFNDNGKTGVVHYGLFAGSATSRLGTLQLDGATGTGLAGTLSLGTTFRILGGGATPTLGTIGGSGPATAAQSQWWEIRSGTTAFFVPIWV